MAGYGDDSGFNSWLTGQGLSLPVGAPAVAVLRQRGSDYIDGLYSGVAGSITGVRFGGDPTDPLNQERAWPRTGAMVGTTAIPTDTVPLAVINASYWAAYQEAVSPGSLAVVVDPSKRVVRERVEGAIDVQYSDIKTDAATDATPVLTTVYGLLKPFLIDLTSQRIGMWSVGPVRTNPENCL